MSTNIYTYGTKILKPAIQIPDEMLTESVIGSQYQLVIETDGVSNPEQALAIIRNRLNVLYNIKMYYGEVVDNKITVQISGSPFAWSAVLMFLPQILAVIGVVVGVITAYLLVSSIPTWVYGLSAVAILLILILPKIIPNIISKSEM